MRDLIRNYKLLVRRKSDTESETESQPLMSSSSSPCHSFGSTNDACIFKNDSDTDVENNRISKGHVLAPLLPDLLQKRHDRRLLHPSAYQNPEFDFCGTHDNACRPLDEILTGEKTLVCTCQIISCFVVTKQYDKTKLFRKLIMSVLNSTSFSSW
jgi:hypothetical protein